VIKSAQNHNGALLNYEVPAGEALDRNEFRKIEYERLMDNYRYGKSLSLVFIFDGTDHMQPARNILSDRCHFIAFMNLA
jgi:hypothetical protein